MPNSFPMTISNHSESGSITPGDNAEAVTPADADLANVSRQIVIGGAGNLVVRMLGVRGDVGNVTFAVVAGQTLNIRCTQVRAATTATGIVSIF